MEGETYGVFVIGLNELPGVFSRRQRRNGVLESSLYGRKPWTSNIIVFEKKPL
jgi:hypothetical protein